MQTFSEGVHLQHCTLPHKIRLWLKRLDIASTEYQYIVIMCVI